MPKLIIMGLAVAACCLAVDRVNAAELRVPDNAVAGQGIHITTSGSGEATFYLVGPRTASKRKIHLGDAIEVTGEELRSQGRWIAIVRGAGETESRIFFVKPDKPGNLSFLARPSRVAVARQDAISGVAFIFDQYHNLVLDPTPVNFSLSVAGSSASHTVQSRDGVAYINSASAAKAGPAQFVAAVGEVAVTRVVQQVASLPCKLRMHIVARAQDHVVVETDPIRDCTGNPVPDGTIVTFTQNDNSGLSVVDARIKKGIARAELPVAQQATIGVAAGVALGNELRVGGGQ